MIGNHTLKHHRQTADKHTAHSMRLIPEAQLWLKHSAVEQVWLKHSAVEQLWLNSALHRNVNKTLCSGTGVVKTSAVEQLWLRHTLQWNRCG